MFCLYVKTSLFVLFNSTTSGWLPEGVNDTAPCWSLSKVFLNSKRSNENTEAASTLLVTGVEAVQ